MPSPVIGIELRISHLGQRTMHRAARAQRRKSIDSRANQRMTKLHFGAYLQQVGLIQRTSSIPGHAEQVGRTPEQDRVTDRLGRSDQQEHPRLRAQTLYPTLKAFLRSTPQASGVTRIKRDLEFRGSQAAG